MTLSELSDLDVLLLRTAILSRDGVVFTVDGTPGAHRAAWLCTEGLLLGLGKPDWSEDREWAITSRGRLAFQETGCIL